MAAGTPSVRQRLASNVGHRKWSLSSNEVAREFMVSVEQVDPVAKNRTVLPVSSSKHKP